MEMKNWREFLKKWHRSLAGLVDLVLWVYPDLLFLGIDRGRRKRIRRRSRRDAGRTSFHKFRQSLVESGLSRLRARLHTARPSTSVRGALSRRLQHAGSHYFLTGNLELAAQCFEMALELIPLASQSAISNFRTLGATYFMLGDLVRARAAFESAGRGRRLILDSGATSSRVRYLGPAWIVAIGHVATLDFYFKMRALGWCKPENEVLFTGNPEPVPGKALLWDYMKYGLRIIKGEDLHKVYDRLKHKDEKGWAYLTDDERFAAMDDFWEYQFPDGTILDYTRAAARIQRQWEVEGRAPLVTLGDRQRNALASVLRAAGVPEGRWYVCLHVREAGFHMQWNATYPTVRDANIDDYVLAVKAITDRGGYVLRMGDSTMKPFKKMPGVFDYAHSDLKNPTADILLPAACRFFVGTNSGYATIPGIYGVPNVLTNWVPVAMPLWFGQDLTIPKMFYDRQAKRVLDFQSMFSTKLGSLQNLHDFPEHIEVRSNTPEEIQTVVCEMLDRLDGRLDETPADKELQERYHDLAERLGHYRGSGIGRDFLRKYANLLPAQDSTSSIASVTLQNEDQEDRRAPVPVAR